MRHTIYSFSFFSIFFMLAFACFSQTTRQKVLFNNDWKFFKGDVKNGEAIKYNDAAWRNVSLPHDWSIEEPFQPAMGKCYGLSACRNRLVSKNFYASAKHAEP